MYHPRSPNVIFYTLQGPIHSLEIHDDKILLKKKGWARIFSRKNIVQTWNIQNLSQFNITIPQYLLWGKVEWKAFDGSIGSFRFSTNPIMMKKIELYLQKRIIKNHQNILIFSEASSKKASKKISSSRSPRAA
jgi:hypothetical protein